MAEQVAAGAQGAVAEEQVNAEVQTNAEPKSAGEETPTGDANAGEKEQERKRLGGWQRKIAKLEAESEFWRNQALSTAQAKPPAQPQAATDPEPNPDDYEKQGKTATDYLKDLAKWNAREAIRQAKAEDAEQRKKEAEQSEAQKKAASFGERIEAAREKFDDYDDVVFNPAVPITSSMRQVLEESDLGAEVAYELAKDAGAEAKRIAQLSPFKQAIEIGKIEARLAQVEPTPAQEAPKPEPVVSKAPPPPTPVKRAAASSAPDVHDPKLSFKDFVKLRNEQVAKRQGK
jgi:hypothetical protein